MSVVCTCVCVCFLFLFFSYSFLISFFLSLIMEIALNNWINSLNTTSSLDIRVAPATRTRGEGGQRPPSPLVYIIRLQVSLSGQDTNFK